MKLFTHRIFRTISKLPYSSSSIYSSSSSAAVAAGAAATAGHNTVPAGAARDYFYIADYF